jgi:hypothetical protein
MPTIVCSHCATPFSIYPSGIGVRVFCSRKCLGASRATTATDFWKQVACCGPDECWEWQGKRDKNGYGCLSWNGKSVRAHRIALSLIDGKLDSSLNVCHTCDNPPCCNPSHLWRGSNKDNMADKVEKNRSSRIGARGEKAGSAKLTAEQVVEIRDSSLSGNQLAKRYGVARNYIFAIKSRKTWRHLS